MTPFQSTFLSALSIAVVRRAPRVLLLPDELADEAAQLVTDIAGVAELSDEALASNQTAFGRMFEESNQSPPELRSWVAENLGAYRVDTQSPGWFARLDADLRADRHPGRMIYLPNLATHGAELLETPWTEAATPVVRTALLATRLNHLLRNEWRAAVVLAPGAVVHNVLLAMALAENYRELPLLVPRPLK